MITRSSIAFEDFLGSSIAPQVMPPCPPEKIAPQKVILEGRRKHHFQSLCLVLPKNSCHGFSNYYIHMKQILFKTNLDQRKTAQEKIWLLQHFTLKLVILVPFSKHDSFFFN